jgi:succinate dehydrogenase / fumarate reductase cytochrome b subunit
MSIASPKVLAVPGSFFDEYIGKKVVMAVSGLVLFGFVVGHLLGNLQVFLGPEVLNAYGEFLRENPGLLWGTRFAVLAAVVAHIWAAVTLTSARRAARPTPYQRWEARDSSYASRTMMISGPLLAAYIVYHLLHLTLGTVHPNFEEGNVYGNLVAGLSNPLVAVVYIVAMVMLGLHLRHGIWSMFQSVGFSHPVHTPRLKALAVLVAAAIVIGYISIPLAIFAGIIGLE